MKKKIISLLIVALTICCFVPAISAADTVTLYVAPTGNDNAAGSEGAPLATLYGAQQKVKSLKQSGAGAIEVIFAEGDYYTRNVTFDSTDSGTAEAPVVYKAADGAKVCFKGSAVLNVEPTEVTSTSAKARIKEDVLDKIVQFDLEAAGISKDDLTVLSETHSLQGFTGSTEYNAVFTDGVEGTLAQWPNGDKFVTWSEPVYEDLNGEQVATGFTYTQDEPDNWAGAANWWVGAFPDYDFNYMTATGREVDVESKTILVSQSIPKYFTNPYSKRWKAFNLLEELDVPGEFYIDRNAMKLYMYPMYDLTNAKIELALEGTSVITINNLSHVTFLGIEFSQSRYNGVTMKDIVNVDFIDCTFKNIAKYGISATGSTPIITAASNSHSVYMSKGGSYDMDIRGCTFEDIGYVALYTHGGDADTLTDSRNIIEDCYFHNVNKRYMMSVIYLGGCGNTLRNNVITYAPKHAITIYGNNHLIEKNEVYDVMRTAADGGAIYQGRNQIQRGTTIKQNYIHRIQPTDTSLESGTCAIYMDDGQQGNKIEQNIIYNAKVGYNSNYAGSMEFINNTIINSQKPWSFHDNSSQATNVHYTSMAGYDNFAALIDSIADKELYFKEYPNLKAWVGNWYGLGSYGSYVSAVHPKSQNVNSGNLAVGSRLGRSSNQEDQYATWSTTEGVDNDNLSITATQEFVDAANEDFRLKSNYYLANRFPNLLNDKNFDMDDIGIQSKTVTFNKNTAPYRALYPMGDTVSKSGFMLIWQKALGANEYKVEISTSADFSRIVWSDTVRSNCTDVDTDNLKPNRRYYWRVTAINTSRQQKATWISDNATGTFIVGA